MIMKLLSIYPVPAWWPCFDIRLLLALTFHVMDSQCYCSCPLIPDVGNLLAGFSYDGSFGLPGISYSNYPVSHVLYLFCPTRCQILGSCLYAACKCFPAAIARSPAAPLPVAACYEHWTALNCTHRMQARRLLQDSTPSSNDTSNDTCSAAVPTLLTFEGVSNATGKACLHVVSFLHLHCTCQL